MPTHRTRVCQVRQLSSRSAGKGQARRWLLHSTGGLGGLGVSVTSGLFTLDSFASLSLQMTPQCRYYTASVTVLLLASSHWPGRCCYCHSCCYRPHEDGATSGLRSGTGQRLQGQALLPCPCWSQTKPQSWDPHAQAQNGSVFRVLTQRRPASLMVPIPLLPPRWDRQSRGRRAFFCHSCLYAKEKQVCWDSHRGHQGNPAGTTWTHARWTLSLARMCV